MNSVTDEEIFLRCGFLFFSVFTATIPPLEWRQRVHQQETLHILKILCYDQHATLLLSEATGYDSQFASASSKSDRKVYHTELGGSDFEIDLPSEVKQDLDCDVGTSCTILLVNMTNRGHYYD